MMNRTDLTIMFVSQGNLGWGEDPYSYLDQRLCFKISWRK